MHRQKRKRALKPPGFQGSTVCSLDLLATGRVPEIPSARAKEPIPISKQEPHRLGTLAKTTAARGLVSSCGHRQGSVLLESKKGNPGEICTGVPYMQTCGCIRRQPVGCVNAAAPRYHYTLDHLLLLEPPRAKPSNMCLARALARRATLTRPNIISLLRPLSRIKDKARQFEKTLPAGDGAQPEDMQIDRGGSVTPVRPN